MSNAEYLYSKLGANEKALVNKIKIKALRSFAVQFIGIKLKLQWKGWLQYLMPTPIVLLIFLLGGFIYLFNELAGKIVFAIGGLLVLKVLLDIIMVKYQIHPKESLPKRNENKNVFELMLHRHSCRSFQNRRLEKNDLEELLASVHKHLPERKISNKLIRLEYLSGPINVWPVVNASEFIIAIAPKTYDRLAIMEVGRTLQKVVIDATKIGLATCWIGAGADQKSVLKQLGNRFNSTNDNIICVCAIGYESKYNPLFIKYFNKTVHKRLPITSLFYSDYEMQKPLSIDQEPFRLFGQTFEGCRWAPSSYNGQTTRCVAVYEDDLLTRFDFYAITSSRYYAAVASGIWCSNWEMGCKAVGIQGVFEVLSEQERNLNNENQLRDLPRYDISWRLSTAIKTTTNNV
jgi:hypothetical protein